MKFIRFIRRLLHWLTLIHSMQVSFCHSCYSVIPDATQFSHHVYLKPRRILQKRSVFGRFKIHLSYDKSLQLLSKEKQLFVKDKLLPKAIKYWEETLEVKHYHSNIKILRQCKTEKVRYRDNDSRPFCVEGCAEKTFCGDIEVPDEHLDSCRQVNKLGGFEELDESGTGVEHSDFILYVSSISLARCQIESTVAYAAYCRLESRLDRPVAGYVNLCPEGISMKSFDEHQMHYTIKHEILHALGFSSGLFAFFRDHHGFPLTQRSPATNKPPYDATQKRFQWSDKVVKTIVRSDWLVRKGTVNKTVHVVVTPTVVREVRRHFNCSSAEGGELEDQGQSGTSITHWEKRMFENELMTGTYTQNLVISRVTLALMEDTGWYKANYKMAGNFEWGKNLGCEFIQGSCLSWLLMRKSRNESIHPFCQRVKTKSIQTECNQDNSAVALCNLVAYQTKLPDEYQHFVEIPSIPQKDISHYGGSVALADYCPYVQEFNWKKGSAVIRGSRCSMDANNPSMEENYLMESYGGNSMCFEHSAGWTVQYCDTIHQVESWGSGCYRFSCDALGVMLHFFNGTTFRCYHEGQVIQVAVTSPEWLHRGSIMCPKVQNLCPESHWSGNGTELIQDSSKTANVPCSATSVHQFPAFAELQLHLAVISSLFLHEIIVNYAFIV